MSTKHVTMYICDSCGFTNENPHKFRRFIGNVLVGEQGGLIGNNIWSKENPLPTNYVVEFIHETEELQIAYSDLCLNCIVRILGIAIDEEGRAIDLLESKVASVKGSEDDI